jgi:hypothetical protein
MLEPRVVTVVRLPVGRGPTKFEVALNAVGAFARNTPRSA